MVDINRKRIIAKVNNKIQECSFDDIDICTLLILIRDLAITNKDYAKIEWETGCLHEICDFVAHRERDRGFVVEEASCIYKHCTTTGEFHFETEAKRTVISGMFEDHIISEINSVFKLLELPVIPHVAETEVLLCIIALLQNVCFESSEREVRGHLFAHIDSESIILLYDVENAGYGSCLLTIEDPRYQNIVDTPVKLNNSCFSLKRENGKLSIILPF